MKSMLGYESYKKTNKWYLQDKEKASEKTQATHDTSREF